MVDIISTLVILLVAGLAATYIIRAKKRGEKCIGCPHSKECSSKNCSCGK